MVLEENIDAYASIELQHDQDIYNNSSNPQPAQSETRMSKQILDDGPTAIMQEIAEIRSHYSWGVRDSALFLGYDLRGASRQYRVPFDKMPLSRSARWLLYGGPGRRAVTSTFVIDTMRGAENMAGHPLTQTEAEGYALHASKRCGYNFAGSMSAVVIGVATAVLTRKTMKFQFRKPQPLEKYDVFPGRLLPVLHGRPAKITWHITRANMYVGLCSLLLLPVFGSMGDSVMMVGLYRDPRTQEFTQCISEVMNKTNGRLARIPANRDWKATGRAQAEQQAGTQTCSNVPAHDEDFYGSSDWRSTSEYQDSKGHIGDPSYADGTTDAGVLPDSQRQSQESQQKSPPFLANRPRVRRDRDQTAPEFVKSTEADYVFDDASPTARDDPYMAAGRGTKSTLGQSASNGSAWERLRQNVEETPGAVMEPPQDASSHLPVNRDASRFRQRPQAGTDTDYGNREESFSFSKNEEDKALAKEQAQKEFDQLLEQERRGIDGGRDRASDAETDGSSWGRRRGG